MVVKCYNEALNLTTCALLLLILSQNKLIIFVFILISSTTLKHLSLAEECFYTVLRLNNKFIENLVPKMLLTPVIQVINIKYMVATVF